MTEEKEIPIANPCDRPTRHWRKSLFRFAFGAYGETQLYVWEDPGHCDSAEETAVEWLDENAPGQLTTIGESDYREAAGELGLDYEAATTGGDPRDEWHKIAEKAECDMIMIGHTTLKNGNALCSWEVHFTEITSGKEYDAADHRSLETELEWPSVDDVAEALRIAKIDVDPELEKDSEGNVSRDVRLQVNEDGSWTLHEGSADYDQDHRGFWGASSVAHDTTDEQCAEIAKDLIDQAQDCFAQQG